MGSLTLSLTLTVSVPPSPHAFCNRAPRRALVHRAHVVLFNHQAAATTIATLQHNIALSCNSYSARVYRMRAYALYHHIHY
jgi:hypothetical protein